MSEKGKSSIVETFVNTEVSRTEEQIDEKDAKKDSYVMVCNDCDDIEIKSPSGKRIPGEGMVCPSCGKKLVRKNK